MDKRLGSLPAGDLLYLPVEDTEVGDCVFLGGALVLRVWVKPKTPSSPKQADPGHLYWQGLRLDQATDGSDPRGNYQVRIGGSWMVLRPASA